MDGSQGSYVSSVAMFGGKLQPLIHTRMQFIYLLTHSVIQ